MSPFPAPGLLKRRAVLWKPVRDLAFRLTQKKLRILTYHGISPRAVPVRTFERQLAFIRDNFTVCWASEIPGILAQGPGPRPALVLTFDDGLMNHVHNALPLLEQYGLKATFYIPAGLVRSRAMLWNHELRCLLLLLENSQLPREMERFSPDPGQRDRQVGAYLEWLKTRESTVGRTLLETLREIWGGRPLLPWMREEYALMGEEEVRNLSPLVEVGSHTLTHPVLTGLAESAMEEEIAVSKTVLETMTGKPVRSFCYPNGSHSPGIVRLVERHYLLAVTTEEGFADRRDGMCRLKRIPAGNTVDDFLLRLIRPTA